MTMTAMTQETERPPLLLVVDGHSMVFRAWFAIPSRLTSDEGKDTRGAYGFLTTLIRTIRKHKPTHIAVTFDTRGPTFRDELFKEYKAQRPPIDPELHEQIPMVENIMEAMKVPVYKIEGFEADDVVGTIVKKAETEDINSLILTGDADQLQLVTQRTNLLMYSGSGEPKKYDPIAVQERYDGLGPEFVAEIKALEGDPSDNIPGIAKVGPKAARTVLSKFGHFDNLYANLDAVGQIPSSELRGAKSVMNRLRDGQKVAYDGLKLTTIVTDVPIEIDFDKSKFGTYNRDELVQALMDLEFRSIIRQIPEPEDAARGEFPLPSQSNLFVTKDKKKSATPSVNASDNGDYEIVTSEDELQKLVDNLSGKQGFAFDTETEGTNAMQDDMVGMSFSNVEGKGWYVPIGHKDGEQIDRTRVLEIVQRLFTDPSTPKAAHNANFDVTVIKQAGIDIQNIAFDTMIAASLCGRKRIGLKDLALDIFRAEMTPIANLIGTGRNQIPMSQVAIADAGPYASADADFTWRLWKHFENELDNHNARRVFENIEMPLLPIIVQMQCHGMVIDQQLLKELSAELGQEIAEIKQAVKTLLGGREFNIASNKQIGEILIDEWGAPKTRRTKTGRWSMDADSLDKIRNTSGLDDRIYELVSGVLRFRELAKLKFTYSDALPTMVNSVTGRVHTTFNQAGSPTNRRVSTAAERSRSLSHWRGSATGRLASTDPNIQNIPARTELGRKIRNAFTTNTEEGWTLLSADYSQIELRILAHMSYEPGLLKAFREGEDIHDATARAMYGSQTVTAEQRRIAKILNFGVIYGLGPAGVARQTDLTQKQGREFINLYFGKYPGIQDFIQRQKDLAKMRGYAETLKGRRRYLSDLHAANQALRAAAERDAVNMPIQGTAADVIKIAMVNIHKELNRREMMSRMTAQVHDELIFEVAPGEKQEMESIAHELMPAAMSLEVPLLADTKSGTRWGELR